MKYRLASRLLLRLRASLLGCQQMSRHHRTCPIHQKRCLIIVTVLLLSILSFILLYASTFGFFSSRPRCFDAENRPCLTEYLTYYNASVPTVVHLPDKCVDHSYCYFYPDITINETLEIRELLVTFVRTVEQANISYFITYGTLLGSLRFNGILPWDDDLDLAIHVKDSRAVYEALRSLRPKYSAEYLRQRQSDESIIKFFRNDRKTIENFRWSFPSMDIFPYSISSTSVVDDVIFLSGSVRNIFPLVRRQFFDLMLYAPRHPAAYLRQVGFDMFTCVSNYWDHRLEVKTGTVSAECSELMELYPTMQLS